MTEDKVPATSKPAKPLLALDQSEDAEFKKKVQAVKKRPNKGHRLDPGVIFVGHLPVGLFEPELRKYFGQFGKVTRLRLSRSKKTGGSKGYAFVEFDCDEVAKIAAETMNNYLMGERLIRSHVVPPEKVHEKMFVGSRTEFNRPKQPAVARYNKRHTEVEITKMTGKLLKKESQLRKRLAEKGIDYDFPGFAAQVPQKKKSTEMNSSTCSEDATPVCTPSVLERRKSMKVTDDDVDDEIILKKISSEDVREGGDDEEEDCSSGEEDYELTASQEPSQGDEAPTDEAPTDEAPTDEAPTDEAPTDEAPTDEAPTEEEVAQ